MSEDDILALRQALPGAVWVSARTGTGMEALRSSSPPGCPIPDVDVDVLVPYDRGDLVARVHRDGEVLQGEPRGRRAPGSPPGSTAALAAALERVRRPRSGEPRRLARPRPGLEQVTARYGDPVTSGVVQDAAVPEDGARVVSVGRPPWWPWSSALLSSGPESPPTC